MNEKEKEVLLITQEECAEVIQAISKISRFGLDAKHPDRTQDNRNHLSEEIGDLLAMIELMIVKDIISLGSVNIAKKNKIEKLRKWSNIFK